MTKLTQSQKQQLQARLIRSIEENLQRVKLAVSFSDTHRSFLSIMQQINNDVQTMCDIEQDKVDPTLLITYKIDA